MLRRRLILVLVVALATGLFASVLMYRAVKNSRAGQADVDQILVAAANVSVGETLTSRHVKLTSWPKSGVQPGTLRSEKDIEGRVARASLIAGEPILDAKLAPTGQGGLMPVLVPPGKRAVSVKVDEAAQKSGFLLPSSRVDVLVTMAPKPGETKQSRIVLQDVTVLAADQTVEMKDNKPVTMTTVTLALSPEETERLVLAQNEGKVTMAIRNLTDASVVSTRGITTAQLLGSIAPAPAKPAATGTSAKRARTNATRVVTQRPAPVAAAPGPTATASHATPPAPVPTHTVAVIRGTSNTVQVFVKDGDKGWVESSGEAKSRPKP